MQLAIKDDEKTKVMGLVSKRKTNLPVDASEQALFLRVYSYLADAELKDTVTSHGKYVDPAGESASSLGGFMMQINKRIKAEFGKGANDLVTENEIETLAIIRKRVARRIARMETQKLARKEIKQEIYGLIHLLYETLIDK